MMERLSFSQDFALVFGSPARQCGWMCQCGVKLAFGSAGATTGTLVQVNYHPKLVFGYLYSGMSSVSFFMFLFFVLCLAHGYPFFCNY